MSFSASLVRVLPMVVASRRVAGDPHHVSRAFLEVAEWLKERELITRPWIGVFDDVAGGGTHVDPHSGQMHGEVWIPFEGEARGDGQVEVRAVEAHTVASALHQGDVSRVGDTVRELKSWMKSMGLRGAARHRQIYLRVVAGAPTDQGWETEVQIPLAE